MDGIDELQAEIMRTLAHPRRLRILHRLADGPTSVAALAGELGINQPNASQHLAVMRSAGIVDAERVGREVRYRLTDPDVVLACAVMRRVLERRLARLARLSPATLR
jgi:ArsR family transcriptional regulator